MPSPVALIALALLLLAGWFFYDYLGNRRAARRRADLPPPKTVDDPTNPYAALRARALEIPADQLGLDLPASEPAVYGVVLDWHMDEGVATLVCFQTGDVSLYLSSGGGTIGGGQHRRVATAAQELVAAAQALLPAAAPSVTIPGPAPDYVRFFLLTTRGRYTAETPLSAIETNTSPWTDLFDRANHVITALRKVAP